MLDLSKIKQIPSPNFQPRGGNVPQIIVLHCPVATYDVALRTLTDPHNPKGRVSAHYLVDTTGAIVQLVQLADAAWHAMHYPNMIGIGIEMVDKYMVGGYATRGCMSDPQWFTAPQLNAVAELVAALMAKFNIPLNKVMGHNDMWLRQFGNNHQDPGPYFPWVNFKGLVQKALKPVQISSLTTTIPELEIPTIHIPIPTKLDIPLTAPRPEKPRKKRGRRLIKPPKRNRIYE